MKNLLVIACMCNILTGCAQNNNSLKTSLQLLQSPLEFKFPLDSTGFSKIKNAKFYTKNGDTDVFDINSDNIHLVDFNNDGQKDIIYQETRHYQTTILLVEKGNDFIEIWSESGALVGIKQGEKTTVYVLSSAIGCFNVNLLSEIVIKSDNTFIDNTIALHSDVRINTIDTTFKQKKISGILRTQPIIDNEEKKDPCTGDSLIGNQIRTIENKEVTVIKKQKDWLLVVYKETDASIIGWINN